MFVAASRTGRPPAARGRSCCGLSLSLLLLLLLAACARAPAPSAPPTAAGLATAGDVHVYTAIVEEPDDIQPFTAHAQVVRRLLLPFTHDTLFDRDPATGELRPALAERFERDADGQGGTFTLRPGVVFADGTPLTMADVLFGYELHRAGHLPMGFAAEPFARLASAEARDDRHLHVRFADRHFAASSIVAEGWWVASRSHFVAAVAARAKQLGQPEPAVGSAEFAALLGQIDDECGPGTGPYRLARGGWQRRQQLELVRNERSWRRTALPGTWRLGGVRLLFRSGAAAAIAFARGEIDWQMDPAPERTLAATPEIGERYRLVQYDHPGLGVFRIVWNLRQGPCQDARVRRAITALLDRQALAAKFPRHGGVAEAFAKRGAASYPRHPGLGHDPTAARGWLREAGFDPAAGQPLRLRLLAPIGSPEIDATVAQLQQACRDAGVDLVVRSVDFRSFFAERSRGEWDGELVQQSFRPWADPFDFLHSTGVDNWGGFADAQVDGWLAAAQVELDDGRRAALWRQVHERVQELQPVTFLLHPLVCMWLNKDLQGAEPGPLGLSPERMWVEAARARR